MQSVPRTKARPTTPAKKSIKEKLHYLTIWQCTKCTKRRITSCGRIARYDQTKTLKCTTCKATTKFEWVECMVKNLGACR